MLRVFVPGIFNACLRYITVREYDVIKSKISKVCVKNRELQKFEFLSIITLSSMNFKRNKTGLQPVSITVELVPLFLGLEYGFVAKAAQTER